MPAMSAVDWRHRKGAGTVERVSKGFYLGSIIVGVVFCFLMLAADLLVARAEEPLPALIILLGLAGLVFAVVMLMVLLYKMWAAIQGAGARTTPGKAVGFLFIPFFNLYWIFQACWGWTKDYNRDLPQRGLSAPRAPEGITLAMCILTFLTWIPIAGQLLALLNFVFLMIFLNAGCDGINALATHPAHISAPEGPPPLARPT